MNLMQEMLRGGARIGVSKDAFHINSLSIHNQYF